MYNCSNFLISFWEYSNTESDIFTGYNFKIIQGMFSKKIAVATLRGSVHFDRFALFSIFVLLMVNFLPLPNFQIKTLSNESCHFWAYFVWSDFFEIDYFYFIIFFWKNTQKTRFCYRRCLKKSKIHFLLIRSREKRSRPPVKI